MLLNKAIRLSTSKLRKLPDFLIIGAGKAGTTSLYDYLCQHSKINPALFKEIHYFDTHYNKGENWYKLHFPFQSITGEASPYYIYHPSVAQRVKKLIPTIKLIIILRNPIDRAYSQYTHEVRNKNESLSFEDAIIAESSRLKDKSFTEVDRMIFSYLDRGKYASQIKTWLKYFPKKQIKIIPFGNIIKTDEIFDFLGLKPELINTKYKLNAGGVYQPIHTETRKKLDEYFKPYNKELFELLENFDSTTLDNIKIRVL